MQVHIIHMQVHIIHMQVHTYTCKYTHIHAYILLTYALNGVFLVIVAIHVLLQGVDIARHWLPPMRRLLLRSRMMRTYVFVCVREQCNV